MAEIEPAASGRDYRVRRFGRDPETAELLIGLIARGEKTATFTSPWLFEADPGKAPVAGGYTVVTDFSGRPQLLLRTVAVTTQRFDEITERESRHEGPAVRPLQAWRKVHWAYFERVLAPLGKAPSPDMPVTMERFELVCRSSAALGGA